jgi:hypothetical protein
MKGELHISAREATACTYLPDDIGWHVDALVLRHKLPQLQTAVENPESSSLPQAIVKGPARFTSDDNHFLSTLTNLDDEGSLNAFMMLRFMISGYSKKQRDQFRSHILLRVRLSGLEIFELSNAFNYFTPIGLNYEHIIERMQRKYTKIIENGDVFISESSSEIQNENPPLQNYLVKFKWHWEDFPNMIRTCSYCVCPWLLVLTLVLAFVLGLVVNRFGSQYSSNILLTD